MHRVMERGRMGSLAGAVGREETGVTPELVQKEMWGLSRSDPGLGLAGSGPGPSRWSWT